MLIARFSLKMFLCLAAVSCLATAGLIAQDEKADEKKPAAADEKKAEEEKKPAAADEKKADEEKKPAAADDKKPADEEKKTTEESKNEAEEPMLESREMVINLDNPSGLAIHEETGHVFIASNDGVHRFIPGKLPLECPLEVSDFPTDVYGKGPKYNISALGLAFLDNEHLVVGDGSLPDGEEVVRVYKVAKEHSGKYQNAKEDAVHTVGPIAAGDDSVKGEGNYYGVAVVDGTVYVTNNGDDTKGWISRFSIKDGKATELEPFIATKLATGVDAPVPIAVSEDGKNLVVGQMGEVSGKPGDSLLTIYDPANINKDDPKFVKNFETGLHDIAGLAYSKASKKWYATDFSWEKPEEGGLFELTIEGDNLTAKKIAKLDKPTALAFDKEGNLYVTVFGTGNEGDAMTPGKLLMIDKSNFQASATE